MLISKIPIRSLLNNVGWKRSGILPRRRGASRWLCTREHDRWGNPIAWKCGLNKVRVTVRRRDVRQGQPNVSERDWGVDSASNNFLSMKFAERTLRVVPLFDVVLLTGNLRRLLQMLLRFSSLFLPLLSDFPMLFHELESFHCPSKKDGEALVFRWFNRFNRCIPLRLRDGISALIVRIDEDL